MPWLGQKFFPESDNGQFILHVRAKSGTRIEETAKLCDLVEGTIRQEIPPSEMGHILDNIGLPTSPLNYMHDTSGTIGAGDADILVSLKEKHRPTADYVRELRSTIPGEYPGATFYFLPADIVTQVLNFWLSLRRSTFKSMVPISRITGRWRTKCLKRSGEYLGL